MAALTACEPAKTISGEEISIPTYSDSAQMPDQFSLMALGHVLSNGRVDLFDPGLTYFETPPAPPQKPLVRPLPFPVNGNYKPKDKLVTFFALTAPADDLEVVEPAPLMQPVPLEIEVEKLDE
ncbi:MAG TPA: hypothetical protein PKI93_01165 [Alphaproteobacteria bacterium]|nr:hypothetical protein [Alphaproteobacteria bacterium]